MSDADTNPPRTRAMHARRTIAATGLLGAWGLTPGIHERLTRDELRSIAATQLPAHEVFEGERTLVAQAAKFSEETGMPYLQAYWVSRQFGGDLDSMRKSLAEARRIEAEERAKGSAPVTPLEGESWAPTVQGGDQLYAGGAVDPDIAGLVEASGYVKLGVPEGDAGVANPTADIQAMIERQRALGVDPRIVVDLGDVEVGETLDVGMIEKRWADATSLGDPIGNVMKMVEKTIDPATMDAFMPPDAARKFAEKAGREDLVALADQAAAMGYAIRINKGEWSIVNLADEGEDSGG